MTPAIEDDGRGRHTQAALGDFAERALPAIDETRLQELRRLDAEIDAAVTKGEIGAYLKQHRAFHFTIYNAAPSAVLVPLIENVWLQFGPFMRMVLNHVETDDKVDRHQEILDALAKKDARALRFAIEADTRDGLGALREAEWESLYEHQAASTTR
jgi:DNA-binding GntR family transcriptional regulator